MIQIIGLLIGVYVLARTLSMTFSKEQAGESVVGRVGAVVCFIVTIGLIVLLLNSGSKTPSPY
jgi:hypothetical protein